MATWLLLFFVALAGAARPAQRYCLAEARQLATDLCQLNHRAAACSRAAIAEVHEGDADDEEPLSAYTFRFSAPRHNVTERYRIEFTGMPGNRGKCGSAIVDGYVQGPIVSDLPPADCRAIAGKAAEI